ncbi:ribosome biogenesis GTPase [Alkalispirochaeta americana]|uniref:Small ribosomal subunit biogenesis GTPase RsgA n=1 Tax=Alkalispirochaeta americana TaxID=159291 RepID=A0A1N6WNP6_9SPIO|nr:ribosome small subunit-dependent GTPase A [Alkalispirochaeta americana]SIQ91675.1 ribosome biogenesis GTPase [Alkalispirochaeta americana]
MSSRSFWGWTEDDEALMSTIPPGYIPARVTAGYVSSWRVMIPEEGREIQVQLAGAFHHRGSGPGECPLPRAGDWVALAPSKKVIDRVFPRRTALIRQEAGRGRRPQVLAANVDTVFLVFGLDGGRSFSLGLLERFLTVTAGGGVSPVVVLNKADCAAPGQEEHIVCQVRAHYADLPLCVTSALHGDGRYTTGLEEVRRRVPPGKTACFLGRSGAGKSSIINALGAGGRPGEKLIGTAPVSSFHGKGRHTTSTARLWMLPRGFGHDRGGMVIDTPGVREVQLWGGQDSLGESFADIDDLAKDCRFRDCRHQGEPGCAVQMAVAQGFVPPQRFEHYLEQRQELDQAATARDAPARGGGGRPAAPARRRRQSRESRGDQPG